MNLRLRFKVLQRDRFRCRYCGSSGKDVQLEVDHLVPRSKNGPDLLENLVTACRPCNQGKKHHLLPAGETTRMAKENGWRPPRPVYQDETTLPRIAFQGYQGGPEHITGPLTRIYDGLDERRTQLLQAGLLP